MRAVAALGCAIALLGPGCGDDTQHDERRAPTSGHRPDARGSNPERREAPPRDAPKRSLIEGAPSAELVFARAQDAVAHHDYPAFLGSIRPATRRRWLTDLLLAVAVASRDDPMPASEAVARTKREMRDLLRARGATANVNDPSQISVPGIERLLIEKVADPDELFVALLEFARAHGAELDPARALDPSSGPSAAAASLIRLANRVRAPHRMSVDLPGAASVSASADRQELEDALLPVRFFTEDGITWLDET